MIVLFWNVCGFGNSDTKIALQNSHIFREGNGCADKMAAMGYLVQFGCRFYLLICSQTFIRTVVECLGLDSRRWLSLLFFCSSFMFFRFFIFSSRVLA